MGNAIVRMLGGMPQEEAEEMMADLQDTKSKSRALAFSTAARKSMLSARAAQLAEAKAEISDLKYEKVDMYDDLLKYTEKASDFAILAADEAEAEYAAALAAKERIVNLAPVDKDFEESAAKAAAVEEYLMDVWKSKKMAERALEMASAVYDEAESQAVEAYTDATKKAKLATMYKATMIQEEALAKIRTEFEEKIMLEKALAEVLALKKATSDDDKAALGGFTDARTEFVTTDPVAMEAVAAKSEKLAALEAEKLTAAEDAEEAVEEPAAAADEEEEAEAEPAEAIEAA